MNTNKEECWVISSQGTLIVNIFFCSWFQTHWWWCWYSVNPWFGYKYEDIYAPISSYSTSGDQQNPQHDKAWIYYRFTNEFFATTSFVLTKPRNKTTVSLFSRSVEYENKCYNRANGRLPVPLCLLENGKLLCGTSVLYFLYFLRKFRTSFFIQYVR